MRIVPWLLALGLGLGMTPALAGPFDGKWIAEIPPQAAPCNGTSVMNVLVMNETVMGDVHTPWGSGSFTGKLDSDGSGTISFGSDTGTVKFVADRFEAHWSNGRCGARMAMGDRAPTPEQEAALTAERKQHQIRYGDLVARADQGDDAVDYTALRAAYPYTDKWDPYGNKTAALMQEALAAQKGGDCQAALDKLDEVLKVDFTIDGAHALRADCLKEAGDAGREKIESAIADGLVRSLMNSGDGDSEKTAYVIGSMREEMDVLANRHITVKTRQTNLRGSDGRYFDLVQGLALKGGPKLKSVYFDVGNFVKGRVSREAATATIIAAAAHE